MTNRGINIQRDAVAERRERIAELTRQGLSARQIAEIMHLTTRSVVRARKALGIAAPAAVHMTEDQLRRAAELLADGASYSEVARTLGRSVQCIANRFPGQGWDRQTASEFATAVRLSMRFGRSA